MSRNKAKAKYKCSEAELYAICKLGWASFRENAADFASHSTRYSEAYGAEALAEAEAAQRLPDEQARGAVPETLRIKLAEAGNRARDEWKKLISYLRSAFAAELVKPNAEAAGSLYYKTAKNNNWENLEVMLTAGKTFIVNNEVKLVTGGMPAGFAAGYDAAHSEFSTIYDAFKGAQQEQRERTDEKVNANNAIYVKLMRVFEDGQLIYDGNAAKRERFIFAEVWRLVSVKRSATNKHAPADNGEGLERSRGLIEMQDAGGAEKAEANAHQN